MGLLEPVTSHKYVQVLIPALFLLIGCAIAIPPLLLDLVLHPVSYLTAPDPISVARSKFFYYAWRVMSPVLDPSERHIKAPIVAKCYGTVLEIGPGVGANIKYYHRTRVERLVLVEPNADMHPALRSKANDAGYIEKDASLLLLGCGGSTFDEVALAAAGIGPESVDCVVCISVLCGLPKPALAIQMYRRLLKSGGLLVFYEHVQSDQPFTARWQRWYNGFWPVFFGGCCLDRPTGAWIAGGPLATNGKGFETGLQTINGPEPRFDVVPRWKDINVDRPQNQATYACLPHVLGWALKP